MDDQNAGTAKLRVIRRLDCEEKKSYQFSVQAISCSGSYSERLETIYLRQESISKLENNLVLAESESTFFAFQHFVSFIFRQKDFPFISLMIMGKIGLFFHPRVLF